MNSSNSESNQHLTFSSPTFGTKFEKVSPPEHTPKPDKPTKKPKRLRRVKRIILSVIALIFIVAVIFGWQLYNSASRLTNEHNPFSLIASLWPRAPAESNGRINILLAGYSADDPNHQGAQLTDSIIIISINPKTKASSLISVPRDLWVYIPGYGQSKINAAYENGINFNKPGYFPGGMGLLEQIISRDFGIKFDYYALIDYTALKDAVNAVGGININISAQDTQNPNGLYDPYTHLKLPNGNVHLDGQMALDLARTRGDGPGSYGIPLSDFTRTMYQQKELVALKDKVVNASTLFNPLTIVKLVNTVGNNVVTNLKIGQMEWLYKYVKGISNGTTNQVTLNDYKGQNLLTNYYIDNQDALVPAAGVTDFSAIQAAVNQIINGN